jgi:hypothetical protein
MKNHPPLAAAFNQGGHFPTIAIVNASTIRLGYSFPKLVTALRKFLRQHFVPVWGCPARLKVYKSVDEIPDCEWPFLFIDDADAANALGYHDLTEKGQPVSKVFVRTTTEAGEQVSVTACHELAEVLIDPGAQLWAQKDGETFVAYETADPVEEQTFEVNGIPMSNFVYPSYFENFHEAGSIKFDHLGLLTKPFDLAPGGYLIISKAGAVSEIFGSREKAERFAREDRRQHRSQYRKRDGHAASALLGEVEIFRE